MQENEHEEVLAALKSRLEDQNQRIEALARGREEDLATINKLRTELKLVSRERDALRRRLTAIESMQTETLALSEEQLARESEALSAAVPSIEDLISSFNGTESRLMQSHSTLQAEVVDSSPPGQFQEMLAPEEMMLESSSGRRRVIERFLVLVDPDNPSRHPLDQDLITIGRSDSADIHADGDFISRIHARVLRIGMDMIIEDAGSKNGTRVNSELIDRHVLRHGDLVRVGSSNFRYFDSAAAGNDED
jgi:hypothetical protein